MDFLFSICIQEKAQPKCTTSSAWQVHPGNEVTIAQCDQILYVYVVQYMLLDRSSISHLSPANLLWDELWISSNSHSPTARKLHLLTHANDLIPRITAKY